MTEQIYVHMIQERNESAGVDWRVSRINNRDAIYARPQSAMRALVTKRKGNHPNWEFRVLLATEWMPT